MNFYKFLMLAVFLINTVSAMSRLLEMACKRNPSLHFCEENPSVRIVQADSPMHFRPTEERLIESRELDDSFESDNVKPLPTASDFSSFDSLFNDEETTKSTHPKVSEPPELTSASEEAHKEREHQETKEESDTQTDEYCTNFEEHFTFYCDRAISSIPKELRSFCISYIANCPKRSQSLGQPHSKPPANPFNTDNKGASGSASSVSNLPSRRGGSTDPNFPDVQEVAVELKTKPKNKKKLRPCTADCDQRIYKHCTKECKCDHDYPSVQRFCNPPPMPLFLETCRLWYYGCPKYEQYHYASQFVYSKAEKGKVLPGSTINAAEAKALQARQG